MAVALNLNGIMDYTRRFVGVVPAIDTGGSTGQPTVGQPNPSNPLLIQAINAGIDVINRVVRCGPIHDLNPVPVNAAPFYRRGPAYVEFGGLVDTPLDVSEITSVVWVDGNNNTSYVTPYNWNETFRDMRTWQQQIPQPTPECWFASGTQVALLPAPSQGGTLYCQHTEAIPPLVNGADVISYVPVSLQSVVQYLAVLFIASVAVRDVEQQSRYDRFQPWAVDGVASIYKWKNGWDADGLKVIRDTIRMMIPPPSGSNANANQSNQ